jgi:transcriptional antiterminator RfaH
MIAWYAVHTRPQAEAQALDNLLRQGYEAYLPRYRARISHARRLQTVLRPLFPRYLFAGIDRAAMRWRPVLSTLGVSDVVRAGDEPMPLPAGLIESLREQEAAGIFNALGRQRAARLGDLVRITAGAFEDMIGRLVELREQDRVVVLLELLGRKVRTEIETAAIETAA